MKEKAKANELFKKYSKGKDEHGWSLCEFDSCAKQCAIIAVDYILDVIEDPTGKEIKYWLEVKKELEKL